MMHCDMHKHLLAWRVYRRLSQEQVGNILGVRHTTIGRWEKGTMRLSTEDLQRLAGVYGTSVKGLMVSPEAEEEVRLLEEFQTIVEGADPEAVRRWMSLGHALKRG